MVVAVFAASSSRIDSIYRKAASRLGELFAKAGITAVYGGGGIGLMGDFADAMLANNGRIIGVIPQFMVDEGWEHTGVKEMLVTETMSERKGKIFAMSNAIVGLPGGIGTLEELSEAITLKQLGVWNGQIVWLNTKGYYNPLLAFFDNMIKEKFLRSEHTGIWKTVDTPEHVMEAIYSTNEHDNDWRKIAKI